MIMIPLNIYIRSCQTLRYKWSFFYISDPVRNNRSDTKLTTGKGEWTTTEVHTLLLPDQSWLIISGQTFLPESTKDLPLH